MLREASVSLLSLGSDGIVHITSCDSVLSSHCCNIYSLLKSLFYFLLVHVFSLKQRFDHYLQLSNLSKVTIYM